jgi:hypothetical protein
MPTTFERPMPNSSRIALMPRAHMALPRIQRATSAAAPSPTSGSLVPFIAARTIAAAGITIMVARRHLVA